MAGTRALLDGLPPLLSCGSSPSDCLVNHTPMGPDEPKRARDNDSGRVGVACGNCGVSSSDAQDHPRELAEPRGACYVAHRHRAWPLTLRAGRNRQQWVTGPLLFEMTIRFHGMGNYATLGMLTPPGGCCWGWEPANSQRRCKCLSVDLRWVPFS